MCEWTIQLHPGDTLLERNFGYFYPGTGGQNLDVIAGRLFLDANGNGIQDADETALVGQRVYLDGNNNFQLDWTDMDGDGQWDDGEGERWILTDESGDYLFDGMTLDVVYRVCRE